ncbi:hypothetical protein [Bradyrhizobium sp. 139]|uniref:hypothetical protein n=1 Tax=Bradyrhizobium sp. 139 TaxID=2782616 RepID=UPI001FF91B5F|nr:hypothetical protein [Bradyrhizobium sp. 139]
MKKAVLTEKRLLGVMAWAQAAVLVSASGLKVRSWRLRTHRNLCGQTLRADDF